MHILQPPDWAPPKGYANGIAARGTTVFVGGQIGWNGQQQFESDDFVTQAKAALRNVLAILAEAGAGPEHITRMTWYVTDKREYVASYRALGAAYREVIGRHFPGDDRGAGHGAHRRSRESGNRSHRDGAGCIGRRWRW